MKPVADDVDFIAQRLKELEEERRAVLERPIDEPADDLPSDVEATASLSIGDYWARYGKELTASIEQATSSPSIYGDPFWDALVRNGVIKIVEA